MFLRETSEAVELNSSKILAKIYACLSKKHYEKEILLVNLSNYK